MEPVNKTKDLTKHTPQGTRTWERLEYQISMLLVLSGGRRFFGITLDVSLGGVFLQLAQKPSDLCIGEIGEIHIVNNPDDVLVFPCIVVRIADHGVAIQFRSNNAELGVFVTHEMLLELLTKINNSFARSKDLESTLITAVEQIKHYLQSEGASLFLVDDHGEEIVCRACAGPVDITGMRLSIHEGIVGKSIREGVFQTIYNANQDPNFAKKIDQETGFFTQSVMCAPLIINGEAIGALELINKRGNGLFAGHDQVVLNALSSATAMAINNARQAEELRKHRDELEILVKERTADLVIAKEKAEDATRLKDKFVSLVAHDLRSPLAAIMGSVAYVLEDEEEPLCNNHTLLLESALNGSKNLIQMIEEVLNISRLKTGKITLKKYFFNAYAMVQEMAQRLDHVRAKKNLTIENSVPINMRLFADRPLIGEVVQNLLSNAIKFSHPETVIRVFASDNTENVSIAIQDQGTGISEDRVPKLFSIAEKTTTPGTQGERGTGFGLPFSWDIMLVHEGSLTVDSLPGEGSIFSLLLPVHHPRILVVDDEAPVRTLLRDMLLPLQVEILEAEHGKAALACIQEHPIHLILSDSIMPIMDGFALLEELQKHPETHDIPFILITAESDIATRDRAFRLGAADFSAKPFRADDLLPRVRNFLGG